MIATPDEREKRLLDQILGVERPITDDDGNIYVIDRGNAKIKRIANDDVRTVSTVYAYGDTRPLGITVLNGVMYVTGTTAADDFVWSIDPETGEQQELYVGRGLFEEVPSTQQATLFAATHDGADLIVASNQGWIFRLSTSAEPLGVVAGYGENLEFPPGLDVDNPIPLDQIPIASYSFGDADLIRHGDDLLFTNTNGIGFHVLSIDCE